MGNTEGNEGHVIKHTHLANGEGLEFGTFGKHDANASEDANHVVVEGVKANNGVFWPGVEWRVIEAACRSQPLKLAADLWI